MDALKPGLAAVFRTVITGDQDQIQQAVNNYREPGMRYDHRYHLYQKQKDGDGRNLLHYVCMYNTDEVATWMLSLRDDRSTNNLIPKDSDKFGVTAVMYAARAGMVTFVTEWIKQNHINTVDKNGRNILHYCCGEGEVINNLPQARRKQNNIDKNKMQQMVQLLIDKDVSYFSEDKKVVTSIKYIIGLKFDKCVSLIASNPAKAIHIWKYKAPDTIKVLSSNQIYPRVKIESKQVELFGGFMHLCVKECFIFNPELSYYQRLKTFEETVLSCQLNVNELDDNGMTALHYLCYYEFNSEPYGIRELLVGKMLELGADPNIKDIRGYTPLMCAVEKGYVVIYDLSDPRNVNEQGIGKLLQGNVADYPKLGLDAPLAETDVKKQMKYMSQKIKAQEDVFRNELERMNKEYKEQQMETQATFNRDIITLKTAKEELRLELQNELQEQHKEINGMKSKINDQHITIDELQKKLQEQCNENKDLKCEVKELQHDQNIQNEMQQKLEEKCHEIINLKIKLEELEGKVKVITKNQEVPSSSLLLGNLVLTDVARHLEADVEVTCLPDASLEDLQAEISKDDQKYKNVYLITKNKNTSSDLDNLILQYRKLIDASKDKATKLIVASILPTLDDGDVNDNIEQLNKELEALCQETGCQFVNNESTFKFMNGTIVEACFGEDEDNLCEFGIKQLLKNLGLLTAKKKKMQATNI